MDRIIKLFQNKKTRKTILIWTVIIIITALYAHFNEGSENQALWGDFNQTQTETQSTQENTKPAAETTQREETAQNSNTQSNKKLFGEIPEYKDGDITYVIDNNNPGFTKKEKERLSINGYEYYSSLDNLGRCGYAEACVGPETKPEDDRKSISQVHPSGWHSGMGYERCHLIAFCLTGENANDHNLVTGTYTMNHKGMLPIEIEVSNYVEDTGHHVMYQVTPYFKDNELVCRGVQIRAQSIEDNKIRYNVFCYNGEQGQKINYKTGMVY